MSDLQAYAEAARVIKEAILRSQYRAASVANKEQLSLYYGIGCYVSKNSREGFWGKGAIEAISQQLQKELPGLRGFSATNIKNMRSFYEEWSPVISRQPMADEFNWADFVAIGKRKLSSFVFVCVSFITFAVSRVITLEHNNEELRNTNGCYLVTQFCAKKILSFSSPYWSVLIGEKKIFLPSTPSNFTELPAK